MRATHRLPTGKKTPGEPGHTRDTRVASVVLMFTRGARAHGHTDHTDEPHNHPNPPSTNAPRNAPHTKPHTAHGRASSKPSTTESAADSATTPEPTEPPWGRVGHTYVHSHSVEALLVLGGPEVMRVVLNSSQRISRYRPHLLPYVILVAPVLVCFNCLKGSGACSRVVLKSC